MRSIGSGTIVLVMAYILGSACFHVGTAAQKQGVQTPDKLDGKWYVVRQEQIGSEVPAAGAKRVSVVIVGHNTEWYIGNPAPNMTATITVDDADNRTIDSQVGRASLNG